MDYFTRWTKVVPLRNANESEILGFLEELVSSFHPPMTIISDNAKEFLGSRVTQFTNYGIHMKTSSNYYPQGNGLAESTNKNLIRVIKRVGVEHKKEWNKHLRTMLWEDRVTPKKILKNSPYEIVYGKESHFSFF